MQIKTSSNNQPKKSFYKNQRSRTAPCSTWTSLSLSSSSTLPTRFPKKTIKSLNFYCLSEIFQYLDFKNLMNFRLVCSFWKECVDFHLARRKHFTYGKQYNNLCRPSNDPNININDIINHPTINYRHASINLDQIYTCQKCLNLLNDKIISSKVDSNNNNNNSNQNGNSIYAEESQINRNSTDSLSSNDFQLSSSRSSSLSVSQTSLSSELSSDSVISLNDDEYRYCPDCRMTFKELETMMPSSTISEERKLPLSREDRNYFYYNDQNIDVINLNIFERILSKLPRLIFLKYAEGYRYGLKQNCLDCSGVNLLLRTYRHCPNLTHIDLSNCVGLIEADFLQLVKLFGSQLTILNVSGCRIDENCLRILVKGCDRLKYLNVANNFCRLQAGCLEWISDRIETIIADYNQNVRVLDGLLQGKGKNIIELELNVGYCFNASMPYKILGNHFQNLISLKIIFKSFGKRKHGIFSHLSNLKELECLYLIEEIDDFDSESSLDDESVLKILSNCGLKLRELYLHAASSLFNNSSALTDNSISQIDLLCPFLEVLSLKRVSITDQSLKSIANLKNAYCVQLIDLEYISEQGIKQIMSSFQENENQHKENIKKTCGIDLNVGQNNGPKVEKLRRK